jgi:hypothetical protein
MSALQSDRIASGERTRPRGFTDWKPRAATEALLDDVRVVLETYRAQLPLMVRQIYYRLAASFGYEKTDRFSERLGEVLNRARRARLIPMSVIRDDGRGWDEPWGFADADALRYDIADTLSRARLDASSGQPVRQMVICEARGMVPMLSRVAHQYGAPVLGTGGFCSLTVIYDLAEQIAAEGRRVLIHHIGDLDPSGVHLFQAMADDVAAFVADLGGDVTFHRLAVTREQADEFNLPTAPPKKSDQRAFAGETVQAEALPPDVLQDLLRQALEANFDREAYSARQAVFEEEQPDMLARWSRGGS